MKTIIDSKGKEHLPDAVCRQEQNPFALISYKLIYETPQLPPEPKMMLITLLTREEISGCSINEFLETTTGENQETIQKGLKELEKQGYLKKVFYFDAETEIQMGSFWAYTDEPKQFNVNRQVHFLESQGYKVATL